MDFFIQLKKGRFGTKSPSFMQYTYFDFKSVNSAVHHKKMPDQKHLQ